jgi:hypothetical protein
MSLTPSVIFDPPWLTLTPRGKCSFLHSPPVVNTLYCLEQRMGEHRVFTNWGQHRP